MDESLTWFKRDSDLPCKATADELNRLHDELASAYRDLFAKYRALFYQQQVFNGLARERLGEFNSLFSTELLVKSVVDGSLMQGDDADRLQSQLIANYFPQWMWDGLTFTEAIMDRAGDVVRVWFTWEVKSDKPFSVEFCIYVPNPKNIPTAMLFNEANGHGTVVKTDGFCEDYKTRVSACKLPDSEDTYADDVGSGYMNSDIEKAIDEYARKLVQDVVVE